MVITFARHKLVMNSCESRPLRDVVHQHLRIFKQKYASVGTVNETNQNCFILVLDVTGNFVPTKDVQSLAL